MNPRSDAPGESVSIRNILNGYPQNNKASENFLSHFQNPICTYQARCRNNHHFIRKSDCHDLLRQSGVLERIEDP